MQQRFEINNFDQYQEFGNKLATSSIEEIRDTEGIKVGNSVIIHRGDQKQAVYLPTEQYYFLPHHKILKAIEPRVIETLDLGGMVLAFNEQDRAIRICIIGNIVDEDQEDPIRSGVNISNSIDGTIRLTVEEMMVREVCTNGMILTNGRVRKSITHVNSAIKKIDEMLQSVNKNSGIALLDAYYNETADLAPTKAQLTILETIIKSRKVSKSKWEKLIETRNLKSRRDYYNAITDYASNVRSLDMALIQNANMMLHPNLITF